MVSAMATKLVPFCSANYQYLTCSTRIPGEEQDEIVCYGKDKPTHCVVYRYVCMYVRTHAGVCVVGILNPLPPPRLQTR